MNAGDPLAAPAPPPPAAPPPPPQSKPPVVPFAATPEPIAPPPAPEPEPPASALPTAAEDPDLAHPSDETPPGYVTAASLWKISAPRPDWATGEQPADVAPPDAAPREAASVSRAAPAPADQAHLGNTRHSFPALPPKEPPPGAEPPKRPKRDDPPAEPNRSRIDGRTAAIVAVVVALAAIVTTAVVLLTGGSEPERAEAPRVEQVAETATPTAKPKSTPRPTADLDAQVKTLDELVRFSKKGRASAVNGNMKAAIANRTKLLRDIRALDKQADDKQLKAALASFDAAIAESLRQNRECASKCSSADLGKVGKLKQSALAKINPLLEEHGGRTYKRSEI
jgi:hypothetical protein